MWLEVNVRLVRVGRLVDVDDSDLRTSGTHLLIPYYVLLAEHQIAAGNDLCRLSDQDARFPCVLFGYMQLYHAIVTNHERLATLN